MIWPLRSWLGRWRSSGADGSDSADCDDSEDAEHDTSDLDDRDRNANDHVEGTGEAILSPQHRRTLEAERELDRLEQIANETLDEER